MIDKNNSKIGSQTFEDARVFLGDAPAAVKVNGKWQFIKKDGSFTSDKKYDDAHSYSNGLAAVCINGKWGFVDENENIVIEPQFADSIFQLQNNINETKIKIQSVKDGENGGTENDI